MKNITYAIEIESGLVISRVDSEIAHPVLEYDNIGKGGNFTAPLTYRLEKMKVLELAGIWNNYRWTKKIPIRIKNHHRKFWNMPPLKARR